MKTVVCQKYFRLILIYMSTIALENAALACRMFLCDTVAPQMGTFCGTHHLVLYRLPKDFGAVYIYLFGCNNNGARLTKDDAVGRNENGSSFYRIIVQLQATFNLTERSRITRHYTSLQKIRSWEQFSGNFTLC